MHYLDDFLIVAGSRRDCDEGLRTVRQVFDELKVPLAPHKVEGPATTLTFLGVEFDSVAAELSASKWPEAVPLRNVNSKSIAEGLLE